MSSIQEASDKLRTENTTQTPDLLLSQTREGNPTVDILLEKTSGVKRLKARIGNEASERAS